MSGFLNRVTLIGNLGQDPETRAMQNGGKVVTLSIATSESWKDRQSGERKQRTEWHRVAIFNPGVAEIAEKYLVKGAKVLIEGKLATRKWQDEAGQDRYTTEIQVQPYDGKLVFLDSKRADAAPGEATPARERAMAGAGGDSDLDDDIPF